MEANKKHTMKETITITIERNVEPFKNAPPTMGGALLSVDRKIFVEGNLHYADHLTPEMFMIPSASIPKCIIASAFK